MALVDDLASTLVLGAALEELRTRFGAFDLVAHWPQGEFHHDVVVRTRDGVLVIATNCNGGIKEVLAFDDIPERKGLWAMRCPDNAAFGGATKASPRARSTTLHYFDPCELLRPDARSELRPEHRVMQEGGGFTCATDRGPLSSK